MLNIERETLIALDSALGLQGRGLAFSAATRLLGALPELDSLAITALIAAIEERFGIIVADEEIDGALFATVASLTDFIRSKVTQ